MKFLRRTPLHTRILIGLVLGFAFGLFAVLAGLPASITIYYIKPVGTIFVNALKMIAMPLILASLIVGVANLGDVSRLSRMGGRTIAIYMLTTVLATAIGLLAVNLVKPGRIIKPETRQELLQVYEQDAGQSTDIALDIKREGPLRPLVRIVPANLIEAAADNANMLQIVFFALIFGVALLRIAPDKARPVTAFFVGLNEVVLRIIDFIMLLAPLGVFALIATLLVEIAGENPAKAVEVLGALGTYALTVIAGLLVMALLVYPLFLRFLARRRPFPFYKGIREAQLLAFSTSSSSATLPVTMECVEKNLGVPEEVSSFVLPLGATINMDGTSLYQSVAAVFIAHALGIELSLSAQITIVLTAVLASIGSAGVPGAGMVMLVIVLEAAGIPAAGLALIIAPDRPLDMCRTVINITGDAMVATVIARQEGEQLARN
jgi:proton glutamate symport protein